MSINFKATKVDGFEKELLYNVEGYLARPVTLDKTSIIGLVPDADGHYIIPQGTLLVGKAGSLFDNPQQLAVQASVTQTRASVTVNSAFKVTAREAGDVTDTVSLVVGTKRATTVTHSAGALVVTLGVDKSGNVSVSYDDVVKLINDDEVANSFYVAEIVAGFDGSTVAAATPTSAVPAMSGGAVEAVTDKIDGVLYHSVDVSDGEAVGTMVYAGVINKDAMPVEPSDAVEAALPHIKFARID